jgi:hypothetical protein
MAPFDAEAPGAPSRVLVVPPECDSAGLTYVELVWIEKRVERWLRFGRYVDEQVMDRRTRCCGFRPGSVFAFVRWSGNARGTALSRLDILRARPLGEVCSTVPGVSPGAEILLRVSGWPKVRRALEAIDSVENAGIPATEVAPDWWRHLHGRVLAAEPFRPYTRERHRAWLLRQELAA